MGNWLVTSLVLSAGLTVALNILPRLFPKASSKAQAKLHQRLQDTADSSNGGPPRSSIKVFFPWKAMLVGSILLTAVVNLGRFVS